MPAPTRVLVLGGGFCAVHAVRTMKNAIKGGRIDAVVVCRDNCLFLHGLIAEMVTGRVTPGALLNPARRIFPPARFHQGEVESIDTDARRVATSRTLDGESCEFAYDHLVLALGSVDNLELYPGLAEHAFKLKRFEDCLRLRDHIIEMLELAEDESDPDERRRLLTFFVAGGGYSGTEVAGELGDFLSRLTKREYRGIRREECRVVIVHPGPTLLPELQGVGRADAAAHAFPKLIEYAAKRVAKAGVEVMLETSVASATPRDVYLSNGEHVPTRTIISAVGSTQTPALRSLGVETDAHGRIVVDEFLRVPGLEGVWAGGDSAAVPHPRGGTCPPTALYALMHGRRIGNNVARQVEGRSLAPYSTNIKLQGVSIGSRRAVGEFLGLGLAGFVPWLFWRTGLTIVTPSWDRRLRLLTDWMLWPVIGRDIAHTGSRAAEGFEVTENLFQPGEVIGERARLGRHVHVVVAGEVELLQAGGTDVVLVTIGPGDHLGRMVLEVAEAEIARAKSLVRTLAVRSDQAEALESALGRRASTRP